MRAKAVWSVLAVSLAVGGLSAPTASAATEEVTVRATKEVTVPATVVFLNGQRPGDPGNCSALVFVQWADVPGTTSATVYYTYEGEERSEAAAAPFHDVTNWVATYTVPAGYHWITVSKGWRDGPLPSTCADTTARQQAVIGPPARAELTVEIDRKACNAAKAKLALRKKAVSTARKQLGNATTRKAKKRLRGKLARVKTKRANAAKRVTEVC